MRTLNLVTGATDGIGLETAKQLSALGATVLVHGRSEAKAQAAARQVKGAVPVWADLTDLAQVRSLAAQVEREEGTLAVLLNNAGVFLHERQVTADGRELTLAVNHDAHVLLTHLLLPRLRQAARARVVNVSSIAHSRGTVALDDLDLKGQFDGYTAYAQSKLANVLFTRELARRLGPSSTVSTFALHPGVINTKLLRTGFSAMAGASLAEGAKTSVYCATAPELEGQSGRYYAASREMGASRVAQDDALCAKFYLLSCQRVGVAPLPG